MLFQCICCRPWFGWFHVFQFSRAWYVHLFNQWINSLILNIFWLCWAPKVFRKLNKIKELCSRIGLIKLVQYVFKSNQNFIFCKREHLIIKTIHCLSFCHNFDWFLDLIFIFGKGWIWIVYRQFEDFLTNWLSCLSLFLY